MFLHMMDAIGGCEDLGLVNVVYAKCFQDLNIAGRESLLTCIIGSRSEMKAYLTFDKVPYPRLGHHGYRDGLHDLLDHLWV